MSRSNSQAGFSLIEVLVAAAILLFVMLGIVPMFLQSMTNNASGNQSSQTTNSGRSSVEEFMGIGWETTAIDNASGNATREFTQVYRDDNHQWDGSVTASGDKLRRVVRIRQYSTNDLYDNGRLDSPFASPVLPSGASDTTNVHLRELELEILGVEQNGAPGGNLGSVLNKTVVLRTLRAF